jgi:hypothetical protein
MELMKMPEQSGLDKLVLKKKKKKNQGKTMPSSCIVSECHTEQHGSRAKMKTHL